jgi:putative transposase
MSAPRYLRRNLNEKQRAELLVWRRARGYPWHSPPHRSNFGHLRFLISVSCFEHRHYISYSPEQRRMLGTARSRRAGRKVFFRAVERAIRSDRHYWETLNYVHHNPVRHGYVARWIDWPWSSATDYLAQTGVEEAKRIWHEYPLRDYGKDWDEPGCRFGVSL